MKSTTSKFYRQTGSALLLGLGLLFSGCATNVNTVEQAESRADPSYVANRHVITDKSLAKTFQVISINQVKVSGNLLKIQATISNLKNNLRTLNYKFEWIDQDGMAVNSPNETWKAVLFQGRETKTLSTVAISPRAVDFTLKLRE